MIRETEKCDLVDYSYLIRRAVCDISICRSDCQGRCYNIGKYKSNEWDF
jgi:hypothetical protein